MIFMKNLIPKCKISPSHISNNSKYKPTIDLNKQLYIYVPYTPPQLRHYISIANLLQNVTRLQPVPDCVTDSARWMVQLGSLCETLKALLATAHATVHAR